MRPWIFVDFDGTLANSLDALFGCYMHFLAKAGVSGSKQEFDELKGPAIEEVVAYLKHKYQLKAAEQELFFQYSRLILQAYEEEIYPMPGAFQFISKASQKGLHFCLVTAAPQVVVNTFLHRFKLAKYFEHICTLKPGENSKPHPDLYLRALKEIGIPASEAIAIEDSLSGQQSAKAAGIEVFSFGRQTSNKSYLHADTWSDLFPTLLSS